MKSSRRIVFIIEYVELFFEEVGDDKWGWVKGELQADYFDDECKFNQRITDIEEHFDDYEITSLYIGEVSKITR